MLTWSSSGVLLAPALAVVVLLAALGYVDLWTVYFSSDAGIWATLVIQLGLLGLWFGPARHPRPV